MWFRHLDYAPDAAVTDLGPAAIDALLERGDLESWMPLPRFIARDPWSPVAETVVSICEAHPMYGTSALFRARIERRRSAAPGTTLAEARARAGLTQSQLGERLGISQSDVSKLERRDNVQLSTLRAYAQAIGARLYVGIQGPDDDAPRPLLLAAPRSRRSAASAPVPEGGQSSQGSSRRQAKE